MDKTRLDSFARSRPAVVMNAPTITREEWSDLLSLAYDGLTFRHVREILARYYPGATLRRAY